MPDTKSVAIMIEKWVSFKCDYLEISFLRENCGFVGSCDRRRIGSTSREQEGHDTSNDP